MKDFFRLFATAASEATGSAWTFMLAVAVIVVWGVSGPLFGFSDTWQLVINTGTTIVTFLMVFLVQNTQNRDAKATHLKLDELLRATKNARTGLVNLEALSDEELAELQAQFERLQDSRAVNEHVKEEVVGELQEELGTPVKAGAL
jgi:low affinity Fe/Cu permease